MASGHGGDSWHELGLKGRGNTWTKRTSSPLKCLNKTYIVQIVESSELDATKWVRTSLKSGKIPHLY